MYYFSYISTTPHVVGLTHLYALMPYMHTGSLSFCSRWYWGSGIKVWYQSQKLSHVSCIFEGFSFQTDSSERVIELMKKIPIPGGCPASVTCGYERTNMSDLLSWTWKGCGMVTKSKASVVLSDSFLLWHCTSCPTFAGLPPLSSSSSPPYEFSFNKPQEGVLIA